MFLTDLQMEIQALCRDFARRELAPNAKLWDREHRFPREAIARLGELGCMGITVPEAWGGAGLDSVSCAVAIEALSRGCASTGVILGVNVSLYCEPLLRHASDEIKRRWLVPFARGEKLGAFALTEPAAGSDVSNLKTTARLDGGDVVIDGGKCFITNGPQADAFLVFALTEPGKRAAGISAFVVPGDAPGLTRGKSDDKMGIRAAGTCSLFFDGCRIPRDHLVGPWNGGYEIAMEALDSGRIGIAAQSVGIGRAALEEALDYARERRVFGRTLRNHQAIQFKLADMATELDAAHLLTLRAAALKDRGEPFGREAAMAKLFASERCFSIASEALQIHGGSGYMADFSVERHLRDARITALYEGTNEIQRIVIASKLSS